MATPTTTTARDGAGGGAADAEARARELALLRGDLLSLCDDARTGALRALGVELTDLAGGGARWRREGAEVQTLAAPRPPPRGDAPPSSAVSAGRDAPRASAPEEVHRDAPPLDARAWFNDGAHAGLYSAFDEDGLPTRDAAGAELSKKARKRLARKYERYLGIAPGRLPSRPGEVDP